MGDSFHYSLNLRFVNLNFQLNQNQMKRISLFLLFVVSVLVFSACQKAKSPVLVNDLKCEFQKNPIGIDRVQPLLQWKLNDERRGAVQTAYQIIVSSSLSKADHNESDIWDSGKIESGQSVHVKYEGPATESGKTYFWKVKIWDQNGEMSKWSETASWEMGLLTESDWQAKWIARTNDEPRRSVYMRNDFSTSDNEIVKARVYVTGLGNYVLYINGERVGEDLLTPGWTDFRKRLEYQVYDVTGLLKSGENAAGAVLGNMWWSGGLGWAGGQRFSDGPLKFLMQLQIEYKNGEKEVVVSDENWKWSNSPIWADHIYDGEKYDATMEQPGWNTAGFDASAWNAVELSDYEGILVGPRAPALTCEMEMNPVALNEPVSGEYVFDMGQNIVGWAKLKINAPKGDTITFRFAELLHDDGTVAQENLRSAKATDKVVSNGEEMWWEPKFTYHGFRYVQISGLKNKPEINDVIGKVIHTSEPFVGSFECSNDLINKINHNVTWGQRGNFYPAPTDCPQRDERLGWMGDAQIFAPTANFNMNLDRYWTKWMFDITDGQTEEGWVHDVSPAIVVSGPSKPGWGDAVVVIPWMTYRYFGDKRILEENYDAMKAWVEYMRGKSVDDIYVWEDAGNPGWYGYGDWIAVKESPSKPIGTAYYYYSTSLLSKMAGVIGKTDDEKSYAGLAEKIAAAYQREYWDAEKLNYPGETQTANLLPLAFGITPKELEPQVVKNLVEKVNEAEVHPTTGFLGTGFILPMLSKYNYQNLAYKMMNQTDYPSWGYMVDKGATTIWELWNSDTERPEGMNSRNHFALGCVGEWMWNNVVGINICDEKPGFKRTIIKPQPIDDLTWAKAEYETNYGKILVDWQMNDGKFSLSLTVPPNSDALVVFPGVTENSVIRENGTDVKSTIIDGISLTEDGFIVAAAGTYHFTLE